MLGPKDLFRHKIDKILHEEGGACLKTSLPLEDVESVAHDFMSLRWHVKYGTVPPSEYETFSSRWIVVCMTEQMLNDIHIDKAPYFKRFG